MATDRRHEQLSALLRAVSRIRAASDDRQAREVLRELGVDDVTTSTLDDGGTPGGLLLAAAERLASLERGGAEDAARVQALEDVLAALGPIVEAAESRFDGVVRRLRADSRMVDTLRDVGQRLTAQLDLDLLVQDATDAATKS